MPVSPLYDYGPPTVVGDTSTDSGIPAVISGAVKVVIAGGHDAVSTGALVSTPGGSPSEESGQDVAFQSTVASTTPATATKAGADLAVTVTGTKFTTDTTVIFNDVLQEPTTYTSATSVSFTLKRSTFNVGSYQVGVQTGAYKSNTVAFTLT